MEEIVKFFLQVATLTSQYPRLLYYGVIVGIVVVTQILKYPFKRFVTSKILNNVTRQKVNTVIMLIPIGVGFLASWLLTFVGYAFCWETGVVWGLTSQVLYSFFATICKRIVKGEVVTEKVAVSALKQAKDEAYDANLAFEDLVNKATKKK